jgi:hypothetical protein
LSISRKETHSKLVLYLTDHPDVPYKAVSAKLGVSIGTISRIATTNGLRRGKRVVNGAELAQRLDSLINSDNTPRTQDNREWYEPTDERGENRL